jgi:hypothetical protein
LNNNKQQNGTSIDDATVVIERQTTDGSVGLYISDERKWSGKIYDIKYCLLKFCIKTTRKE